ncbi:MAG: TrbG/VirB9 family P-type conjugative transfer protein, partial [Pollutimonas bauzanensis]
MLLVAILSGLLPACAGGPDWSRLIPGKPGQSAAAHYSFAWRLSGDRAVAPLQVFDNGRQTWLQFAPRQALPAIFEHTAAGDRPL